MGYAGLDAPTMTAISDPWVDENRDRPLLASEPLTAGLVPILEKAHQGLLAVQLTPSNVDATLRALSERALRLDLDHDARYRALHAILTGWAAVSGDERRGMIENILSTLWPDGLSGTQRTYLAEAGAVELSVSRLTPEMEETLRSIVVDERNLLQMFNEWVQVGRQLGEVERERVRLAEQKDEDQVTARDVQEARYFWIRAVNALSNLLALESDFPEDARIRILQPLLTAEEKFARKRTTVDPTEGLDPTAETADAEDAETSEDETVNSQR